MPDLREGDDPGVASRSFQGSSHRRRGRHVVARTACATAVWVEAEHDGVAEAVRGADTTARSSAVYVTAIAFDPLVAGIPSAWPSQRVYLQLPPTRGVCQVDLPPQGQGIALHRPAHRRPPPLRALPWTHGAIPASMDLLVVRSVPAAHDLQDGRLGRCSVQGLAMARCRRGPVGPRRSLWKVRHDGGSATRA